MRTVRDHIASHPAVPAPPAGATHVLAWEPYGSFRSRWALVALDGSPDDDALFLDRPADVGEAELAGFASGVLFGCPVILSSRMEVQDEAGESAFGYYVTPAGGDR